MELGEPTSAAKSGARKDLGRGVAGRNFGRGEAGNGESPPTENSSAEEADRRLRSEMAEGLAPNLRADGPAALRDGDLLISDPAKEAVLKQPGGDSS